MSNFEIETAFNLAYNYEERINSLYQKRLNEINSGEYHINIPSPTRMLIHLISIDALDVNESMDLEIVFNNFKDYEISFLEKVAENIASTITILRINIESVKLQKQFREQNKLIKDKDVEIQSYLDEIQSLREKNKK